MVPGHQGPSCVEGREILRGLLEFTVDGVWGGGGNKQICTNKCSKMNFSPVQGKEKNKLKIVSSVFLTWKNKKLATYTSPKLFLKFYCGAKSRSGNLPDLASLAPSPWFPSHLPLSPPYWLLLLFTGGPQPVACLPY